MKITKVNARRNAWVSALVAVAIVLCSSAAGAAEERPLRVVATVADLGSLAREVGGDQVTVTTLARPTEDPHFIEAKPSFVKAVAEADAFLYVGMEMEVGYAPVLLGSARNASVLTGGRGNVDCSTVIEPLAVPTGPVDRSQGDVHGSGNPHYLLDPLNGLKVAALIRDRLAALRPEQKPYFAGRFEDFRTRLGAALLGERLSAKYPGEIEKLARLAEHGKLGEFLKTQGEEALIGGWCGAMVPHHGTKYVDEHDLWVYFARRFGLVNVGHLEPIPGVPPTTRHLGAVIKRMRDEKVPLVISVPYYEPKHARLVSEKTGARVARLAHQAGAVDDADDYISMFDANVRAVEAALGGGR